MSKHNLINLLSGMALGVIIVIAYYAIVFIASLSSEAFTVTFLSVMVAVFALAASYLLLSMSSNGVDK